jgi:hypothetical protein
MATNYVMNVPGIYYCLEGLKVEEFGCFQIFLGFRSIHPEKNQVPT